MERIGATASTTMMFEDSVKNLRTCKKVMPGKGSRLGGRGFCRLTTPRVPHLQMGMTTVLVAGETAREEGAEAEKLVQEGVVDFVIANCSEVEVRRKIPGLFRTAGHVGEALPAMPLEASALSA